MIHQFSLISGKTAFINLDAVSSATPNGHGFTEVRMTNGSSFTVNSEEFAKAVAAQGQQSEHLQAHIRRLIEAMDRMTVHFPTSIKMHM